MPDWIAENAFLPFITGLLFTGILGAFAFMLQSRSLAIVASIICVLSFGLIFAERYIITDKEKVVSRLYAVANAVEFNRHEEVLTYMKANSLAYKSAKVEMPRYDFRRCSITGIKSVQVNENTIPKTATMTFVVFVDVNAPSFGHDGFGRREVTVSLEQQDDESWQIIGYSHRDPRSGARL